MTTECARCVYWNHIEDMPHTGGFGFCRRHAPLAVTVAKPDEFEARWPVTCESDWCGEHHRMAPEEGDQEETRLVATQTHN